MSIKLFACGDIVNKTAKKDFVDKKLKAIIKNSDVAICNFEAPIKTNKMSPINKVGPHVYQSIESITCLKNVGFDILSLANNHIYDYGDKSLKATINEITNNHLEYIGAGETFEDAYQPKLINSDGIKIGLLSACEADFGCLCENENRGGSAWLNHYFIQDKIRELRKSVDILILVAHAGVEGIDVPLPEWREKYKRFCDLGVDILIGHHPHVPQGFEKYKQAFIFYSLGNFYFDTCGFENKADDTYSVLLELNEDGLIDYEIIFHKKVAGQTILVKKHEVVFSLESLNNKLH